MIIPLITDIKNPSNEPEDANWQKLIEVLGGAKPGSKIAFKQDTGHELIGDFTINPLNTDILSVTFDIDTLPQNSSFDINGFVSGVTDTGVPYQDAEYDPTTGKQFVDMIVEPSTFNPIVTFGGLNNIPYNYRLLVLDGIGADINVDGADAWAEYSDIYNPTDNNKLSDLVISANSIIAWNGAKWVVVFNPERSYNIVPIMQNMRTLVKYKFINNEWVKAFEGEYAAGNWTLLLAE